MGAVWCCSSMWWGLSGVARLCDGGLSGVARLCDGGCLVLLVYVMEGCLVLLVYVMEGCLVLLVYVMEGYDTRIADVVSEHVRVLCWVLVQDGAFHTKAVHINNTWGKRCDRLLFFGSTTNETSPVIGLGVKDGRHRLAKKTFAALAYVFKHHFNDADWFLKADVDTFVVMENLKYFLSDEDTTRPVWFGEHYKPYLSPWSYNSGGAGYVLSREALRRFGSHVGHSLACTNANGPEDATLGYCLQTLNVKVGNTTDKHGRSRFHFDMAPDQIAGRQLPWYKHYLAGPYRKGLEWMSDYPISFHYAKTHDLLALEFFFYTVRPRGVFRGFPEINRASSGDTRR
ncbi:glycoprotein-N-acetylgalactosamine 3-beta-galactosyltransferase 1-like [Gigantopelta aegis]|uniref:glycoprotein-N-acetylgalactosamine 3-beta-galactosyltransferase 1-like n=1 Tax=Gigantopelta aegis TaxID=1735272 RepID=UPI001B88B214|nr:glycoprotein-N-acetylgalactosamine 3-beta-galactosyltransferase 1-like [Gigantopelta aegis]